MWTAYFRDQLSCEVRPIQTLKERFSNRSFDMVINLSFEYPKTWELKIVYTNKDSDIDENRALLISPNNFALQIDVPSNGPSWQFGERPLACPFNEGYQGFEGGDDNHPDACPFYKELLSEKVSNLEGLSIVSFESSWETTEIAPNITSLILVKTGCKVPENNLCERPSAKAGYYLDIHGGYYEKISTEDRSIALLGSGSADSKRISHTIGLMGSKYVRNLEPDMSNLEKIFLL